MGRVTWPTTTSTIDRSPSRCSPGLRPCGRDSTVDREIHIAATLNHPNIVPLYDSGEFDGQLFYVMPYIEGESLRQRLERETMLPMPQALEWATEIADGLAVAHAGGIVHRDIKPENLLIQGGHILIADFGIARAIDLAIDEGITTQNLAVGTPRYMSPEQASGAAHLDGRAISTPLPVWYTRCWRVTHPTSVTPPRRSRREAGGRVPAAPSDPAGTAPCAGPGPGEGAEPSTGRPICDRRGIWPKPPGRRRTRDQPECAGGSPGRRRNGRRAGGYALRPRQHPRPTGPGWSWAYSRTGPAMHDTIRWVSWRQTG